MSLIKKYEKAYGEVKKLKNIYLRNLYCSQDDIVNLESASTSLSELTSILNTYEKAVAVQRELGQKICEYSTINWEDAQKIFPAVISDATGENFYYDDVIRDGRRLHVLKRKNVKDNNPSSYSDAIASENVILLYAQDDDKLILDIPLYFSKKLDDVDLVCTSLSVNGQSFEVEILVDFVKSYIDLKEQKPTLTWQEFYSLWSTQINHGYDEELLDFMDDEDAYVEHDRRGRQLQKKRKSDYYHKIQKRYINQIQAQKKLEKLPNKYNK